MTPDQLEEKLNLLENNVVNWLSTKSKVQLCMLLLLLLGVSFSLIFHQFNFKYTFVYFLNFTHSFRTILVISLGSLGMLFFEKQQIKVFWIFFVFIFCAFFDFSLSRWPSETGDYTAIVLIFLQSILGYFAWSFKGKFNKTAVIWIYLIASLLLLYLGFRLFLSAGWYYFHQPIIFSAFVIAIMLEDVDLTFDRKIFLLMNPSHLFLSVNYPIGSYLNEVGTNKKVWETGLVHLAKAMLSLYLACSFFKLVTVESSLFLAPLKDYIMYLLVVVAVGNTITGLSRLFLINVPVCSNFAFLSRSPLDFMKRENAHAYIFSLRFFYFNFLKYTKNSFVIVLGYFLVFPFYRNILVYFSRNGSFDAHQFYIFLLRGYLFWFLLLMAIILFPRKILKRHNVNEWFHVLLNSFMLYLVFMGYRYCSFMIELAQK